MAERMHRWAGGQSLTVGFGRDHTETTGFLPLWALLIMLGDYWNVGLSHRGIKGLFLLSQSPPQFPIKHLSDA